MNSQGTLAVKSSHSEIDKTVLAQLSYNRPRREHRLVIIQGDIYVAAIVGCADLVADGRIILLPGGVATGIGYFLTLFAGARYPHSVAVVFLVGCLPGVRAGGVKSSSYPPRPVVPVRASCAEQSAAAYESDRGRSVGGGNHLVGERPV